MEENKLLHALYTVFLGVLIALFVGVGISTFYPGPEEPDYAASSVPLASEGESEKQRTQQTQYEKEYEEYDEKYGGYNRNVSIIALVSAVLFIVLGFLFESRIKLLASGIMLGGIFTLIYSIGRGFAAEDSRYVFVVLTISLAIIFYLGYRRFVNVQDSPKKSKKR